ncbi:MAG: methyl-accepting chemotaxis protein [Verrucomicrobiota bacterium]|nr:methyl-accepting chemotaxis protein [Verrucomicrobiota bacterium]
MKNWTIGKRILCGFGSLIAINLVLWFFSYIHLKEIKAQSNLITTQALPGVYLIGQIESAAKDAWALAFKHISSASKKETDSVELEMKEIARKIDQLLIAYEKTISTERDRELWQAITPARQRYLEMRERIILPLSREHKTREALTAMHDDLEPVFNEFMGTIRTLADFNRENGEQAGKRIEAGIRESVHAITFGVLLALLIAIGVAFTIIRSTSKLLTSVSEALNDGSEQVASAATQVSASSQSLAEGASEQAASLEETSASLEEMSSMTKRNAENAESAKDLANQTRAAADTGFSDMKEMTCAMAAIKSSSDNIAKIIKTIDEIAFQTNILALNAAVEAARAGEAGMGFAVVADEVRNLAQRSAQAARETAEKIEDSIRKSEQGVQISSKVARSLEEIVLKAHTVDELVGQIASASREQSQGIQQVSIAVTQMDKVTQSNAANAEESASASEELNAQAVMLKEAVDDLMNLVSGKTQSKSKLRRSTAVKTESSRKNFPNSKTHLHVNGRITKPVNGNGHTTYLKSSSGSRNNEELPMDGDFKDF